LENDVPIFVSARSPSKVVIGTVNELDRNECVTGSRLSLLLRRYGVLLVPTGFSTDINTTPSDVLVGLVESTCIFYLCKDGWAHIEGVLFYRPTEGSVVPVVQMIARIDTTAGRAVEFKFIYSLAKLAPLSATKLVCSSVLALPGLTCASVTSPPTDFYSTHLPSFLSTPAMMSRYWMLFSGIRIDESALSDIVSVKFPPYKNQLTYPLQCLWYDRPKPLMSLSLQDALMMSKLIGEQLAVFGLLVTARSLQESNMPYNDVKVCLEENVGSCDIFLRRR
jgi:hypothetical protein